MAHFLLIYDLVGDYVDRRAALRTEHLGLAWAAVERGELLLGGPLADRSTKPSCCSAAIARRRPKPLQGPNPYVINGLVTRWQVRSWTTVAGDLAATPLRF